MCLCSYRAQSLKVLSSIDTTIANIGDQLIWDVILKNINDNYKLDFPILSIENDSISILSQENIIEDNKITGQRFKISYWEIGEVYTPDYFVKVIDEKEKEDFKFIGIFSEGESTEGPIVDGYVFHCTQEYLDKVPHMHRDKKKSCKQHIKTGKVVEYLED